LQTEPASILGPAAWDSRPNGPNEMRVHVIHNITRERPNIGAAASGSIGVRFGHVMEFSKLLPHHDILGIQFQ
jgi:hypothetical protein